MSTVPLPDKKYEDFEKFVFLIYNPGHQFQITSKFVCLSSIIFIQNITPLPVLQNGASPILSLSPGSLALESKFPWKPCSRLRLPPEGKLTLEQKIPRGKSHSKARLPEGRPTLLQVVESDFFHSRPPPPPPPFKLSLSFFLYESSLLRSVCLCARVCACVIFKHANFIEYMLMFVNQ